MEPDKKLEALSAGHYHMVMYVARQKTISLRKMNMKKKSAVALLSGKLRLRGEINLRLWFVRVASAISGSTKLLALPTSAKLQVEQVAGRETFQKSEIYFYFIAKFKTHFYIGCFGKY
jgi:hypothetical protein